MTRGRPGTRLGQRRHHSPGPSWSTDFGPGYTPHSNTILFAKNGTLAGAVTLNHGNARSVWVRCAVAAGSEAWRLYSGAPQRQNHAAADPAAEPASCTSLEAPLGSSGY